MKLVELPGGVFAEFPSHMSDAEIEAALAREFAPVPESLAPGEVLRRPNGCEITWHPNIARFRILDMLGKPAGYRETLAEAARFADGIQPPPPPRKARHEPKPERELDAATAAWQVRADIERSIRQQQSRERFGRLEDHRRGRYRNRGTV